MNQSNLKQKDINLDTLIFFDIETTGRNSETARIIEIGAVKTKNLKIVDKFHSLVNPNQHIPIEITKLTGIDDKKVKNAPKIEEVLPSFFDFIKDYPLIAHNVNFDKKFIETATRRPLENILLDTMELACLVLPLEREHNLNALIKKYCHLLETHRALDDTKSLVHLCKILIQKIKNLDPRLQSEIKYLTQDLFWPWKHFFADASLPKTELRVPLLNYPIKKGGSEIELGDREEDKNELNDEEIASYFQKGGYIYQIKKDFEERKEQIEMARDIAKALNQEKHLVIEAGTGVGKSLAYLIPVLLWTKTNKNPVIVSTHTKILQSQLENDIPLLKKIFAWDFRYQIVKGRKNYLCPLRWFRFYRQIREKALSIQEKIFDDNQKKEMENYKKKKLAAVFILNWLWQTKTGDLRDELSFWLQEKLSLNNLFSEITSDANNCLGEKCPYSKKYYKEKNCYLTNCPVLITRNKARDADLIIVNHALLLEDKLAGRDNLLPKIQQLVIDEAYHIEHVATETLTEESSGRQIKELLENVYSSQKTSPGFLQIISSQIKKLKNDTLQQKFSKQIEEIIEICKATSNSTTKFFYYLEKFINNSAPEDQESNYYYSKQLRLREMMRNDNEWKNLLPLEADLRENFKKLRAKLEEFYKEFEKLKNYNIKYFDFLLKEIEATVYEIKRFLYFHQQIIDEPRDDFVYWLENVYFKPNEDKEGKWFSLLKSAPINVGRELKEKLYDQIKSIIFTSATLTINNSFDFIKSRLGFNFLPEDKIIYRQLFSPFDYSRQVLFIITSDLPKPDYQNRFKDFLQAVNETIPEIIKKNKGGALVLCTSHKQIDFLYPRTRNILEKEGRQVLRQQKGMSTKRMVEKFKEDRDSIMFGTYSLWEGIDIPGESLSCLIMVKLPFDSPKNPLIEARMEYVASEEEEEKNNDENSEGHYWLEEMIPGLIKRESKNRKNPDSLYYPFYYYPLAIIRLKQGFGRLIRNKADRGIFVIFDKRLKTNEYSEQFLNSLPYPINNVHKYLPLKESLNEIEKFYSTYIPDNPKGKIVLKKYKCENCGRLISHRGKCLPCNVIAKYKRENKEIPKYWLKFYKNKNNQF
jgi:ATP-dependent DNA helicase DinG